MVKVVFPCEQTDEVYFSASLDFVCIQERHPVGHTAFSTYLCKDLKYNTKSVEVAYMIECRYINH